MKTKILLLFLAFVVGCGIGARKRVDTADALRNHWVGKHVDDLILDKGAPSKQAGLTDGTRIYEYVYERYSQYQHTSGSVNSYGQYQGNSFSVPINNSCYLKFIISTDNLIKAADYSGKCRRDIR